MEDSEAFPLGRVVIRLKLAYTAGSVGGTQLAYSITGEAGRIAGVNFKRTRKYQ